MGLALVVHRPGLVYVSLAVYMYIYNIYIYIAVCAISFPASDSELFRTSPGWWRVRVTSVPSWRWTWRGGAGATAGRPSPPPPPPPSLPSPPLYLSLCGTRRPGQLAPFAPRAVQATFAWASAPLTNDVTFTDRNAPRIMCTYTCIHAHTHTQHCDARSLLVSGTGLTDYRVSTPPPLSPPRRNPIAASPGPARPGEAAAASTKGASNN